MSTLFLVSGERSGDLHAAELLDALQETPEGRDWSYAGLGGPELRQRYGDGFEDWIEEAAVIGITEVLKKYGWFKQKMAETIERIMELNPVAVVMVDYPGFNLRLAKALRKMGYPGKICYYVSPQVWAWNKGRIPKMALLLDLMLCVFEFEKDLYEDSGLKTEWVGHPMVEELEERRVSVQREEGLVGLFPGSRSREVKSLLPVMLDAAEALSVASPEMRFELAVASEKVMELVKEMTEERVFTRNQNFSIVIGQSHSLMQRATAGWVASGTATLEAGFYEMPYALVYKVSALTYAIAKMVVKIPYIGMVNILANKLVVKEFIQAEANKENLLEEMNALLSDKSYREEVLKNLRLVRTHLGGGGAHQKAAQAIVDCLS